MKDYKIISNRTIIYTLIFFGLVCYILDIFNVFIRGKYLTLIILFLIVYNFIIFFIKGIVRISFSNQDYIILHKYTFFKLETLELNIFKLKYKYKRCVSYPNEYYKLFFIYEEKEILINSSGGEFFSFRESDEKKIVEEIEKLKIKKIQ